MRAVVPSGASPAASSQGTTGEPSRSCHGEGHVRRIGVPDVRRRVPPGYGERHVRTVWFGTGEARLRSLVSKDHSYKPMVKSGGAQRESDGVVVPLIAVSNAVGGKGPDFGHAGDGVSARAWPGPPGPTTPRAAGPAVNVRQLQNRLWAAAKQSSGRRFHALYDRIHRDDVLWEAWERVRANRGAAGVDQVTVAAVEEYGVDRMFGELAVDLRAGRYRPAPVRRVEIPKPDGAKRPLGIPTVRGPGGQQAAKLVLEPIFEADFLPCSFGFRPKRSATDALEAIRVSFPRGRGVRVRGRHPGLLRPIDHDRLMGLVEERCRTGGCSSWCGMVACRGVGRRGA